MVKGAPLEDVWRSHAVGAVDCHGAVQRELLHHERWRVADDGGDGGRGEGGDERGGAHHVNGTHQEGTIKLDALLPKLLAWVRVGSGWG